MKKNYVPATALVVHDTSGVDWDWDLVIDELVKRLELNRNPFDMGVWILNLTKDRLFKVF
ncbi:MAG: hypothetical protein AB1374_11175 [Bacillota bacterium]